MSTLSPERWREISPQLDHALSLPEEERAAWLAALRAEHPETAHLLETLLAEHRALSKERFLERGPERPRGEAGLPGQTFGAYRLLSPIGQGGMGSVWLAERSDGRFQRRVAVKVLRFAVSSQDAERFKREGEILGRLADPHIAELIDAGVTPTGEPFLVIEHVEGEAIDAYCDRHKLDVDARLHLFLDVLSAVAEAHAHLIVHRDIKPPNVLVREDGQVKLLDFGIAKLLEDEGASAAATQLTLEGGVALTPRFAAPEQVTGGAVTTATDVYALGVLLYLLLTGQHPAGPGPHSPAGLVKAITETEPLRPSDTLSSAGAESMAEKRSSTPDKLRRVLRGDLDTIVAKALKKHPRERYGSVTALADDLRRYLKHEPISARPDTAAYRAAKFVRRNRPAVALVALAVAAVIAGSAVAIYQGRIAQRRFQDVRKLAHTFVFDLHDEIARLEGSTRAREMIVRTGLEYLDDLARNASGDLELQREIAAGYMKIGDAEGFPTKPNLGRIADALAGYRKSGDIYEKIAAKNPAYLPDLATFYLNYAGLVRFTDDRKQARALSESAIQTFDRIRARQRLDGDLEVAYTRAWCRLGDLDEDMGHYTQAWKEFANCGELARLRLARLRDQQALLEMSLADERIGTAAGELGLFEQALGALDEDESLLGELLRAEPRNPRFHRSQALVHSYRLEIYYSDLKPNLNDAARALESGRRYLAAAEAMVRSDSSNTSAQLSRAIAMYAVSLPLREFDAIAALRMAQDSVRIFDGMVASQKPSYLVLSRRVRALVRLGQAQLKAGRLAEARATAESALAAERPIAAEKGEGWEEEKTMLAQALLLAGKASAALGDSDHAENLLREARRIAQEIAQSRELTSTIPLANADQALGAFYARRHRTGEARACYQELIESWQLFPQANEYVDRQKAESRRLLASVR